MIRKEPLRKNIFRAMLSAHGPFGLNILLEELVSVLEENTERLEKTSPEYVSWGNLDWSLKFTRNSSKILQKAIKDICAI